MSFSAQIDAWCDKAPERINLVKQRTTLRLFAAVVKDTPVLEGTLRSDWQITTGAPAQSSSAMSASMETVIGASGLKDVLFLTNHMPYAYGIEFLGWSHTKAPQGMMRKNAMRFQTILKQEIRRANNGTG